MENREKTINKINNIVNKCLKAGLRNDLKKYTIPYLRNYMLQNNPEADNRLNPWTYLINEIKKSENISLELQSFINDFIREANQCYKDNIKIESRNNLTKLINLTKSDINKLMDIFSWYSFAHYYNDNNDLKNEEEIFNFLEDKLIYKHNFNLTQEEKNLLLHIINNYEGDIESNHIVGKGLWSKMNKLIESKLEEVSRNDLLAKSKLQTKTRYEKSAGYKGFNIVDIDTTSVFTTNCLRVTCRVGDYYDTIEVENILYWVQAEAENEPNNQINTKSVTRAIMDAIDGMNIKVDCTCPDFYYRFSYMATKLGYKYGKPQNIPAPIRNPNDYGAMCKHLISMLSNKKWLQQVTGTLMDFLVERIDDVNKFLKVKPGEELTLPNELARQNAKKGFYSKLFKDTEPEEEIIEDEVETEEPEEEEELIDVDNEVDEQEENNDE